MGNCLVWSPTRLALTWEDLKSPPVSVEISWQLQISRQTNQKKASNSYRKDHAFVLNGLRGHFALKFLPDARAEVAYPAVSDQVWL